MLVAYLLATRGFLLVPGDSSGSDLGVRVIAPLLFGFFGLVLAIGAVVGARRLLQRRVLEVGPDGLWAPQVGRLAWSDIREIRHEVYSAPASRRGHWVRVHRLGIVPVDATRIHLTTVERAVQMLSGGYAATIGRAGRFRFGDPDMERFGVSAADIDAPFDEVLARVAEFFPIGEAASPR